MDYNQEIKQEILKMREEREKRRRRKLRNKLIVSCAVIAAAAAVIFGFVKLITPNDTGADVDMNIYALQTSPPSEEPESAETETDIQEPAEETSVPTDAPTQQPQPQRRGTAEDIPYAIRQSMAGKSMSANSTVSYDELAYLTIPHYDFNYNTTLGHMVVNKAIAEEVLDIFAELYDIKYPIERMELIDKYNADDYTSIEYNNTSAFNYRVSTDGTGRLSKHALGRAIDINPQINPYVPASGVGSHSNAKEYWSRNYLAWTSEIAKAAYIGPEAEIYRIFVTEHGWEWGGSWSSYRDYQHFQKMQ